MTISSGRSRCTTALRKNSTVVACNRTLSRPLERVQSDRFQPLPPQRPAESLSPAPAKTVPRRHTNPTPAAPRPLRRHDPDQLIDEKAVHLKESASAHPVLFVRRAIAQALRAPALQLARGCRCFAAAPSCGISETPAPVSSGTAAAVARRMHRTRPAAFRTNTVICSFFSSPVEKNSTSTAPRSPSSCNCVALRHLQQRLSRAPQQRGRDRALVDRKKLVRAAPVISHSQRSIQALRPATAFGSGSPRARPYAPVSPASLPAPHAPGSPAEYPPSSAPARHTPHVGSGIRRTAPKWAHRGCTRSSEAVKTSDSEASPKAVLLLQTRASTNSPGSVNGTKTALPASPPSV